MRHHGWITSTGRHGLSLLACVLGVFLALEPAQAHDPAAPANAPASGQGSLAEIGAKLSNRVSDVWALFTQFGLTFSDGDANREDAKVGGNMIFQPILPVPLYGEGDDKWKMIVRPSVPLLLGQPVPRAGDFDSFSNPIGLGVAKTVKIGSEVPVLLRVLGGQPDDFGQRFQIKLNVLPVIRSLVKNSLF